MAARINLKELSQDGLRKFISDCGLPRFRSDQLLHWMYEKYATCLDGITELSKNLRIRLNELAYIGGIETARRLVSSDGTEKYLFRLEDGETIESVLIPDEDRLTLCVSSQVGCAMGCAFCMTGRLGLVRNLKAFEVVEQIISVNRIIGPDRRVTNVVLMGMGEPLANFDEVVESLWRMTGLMGISKRRITLSTSGLVPQLGRLPGAAPDVNLAVSLNATTDETRDAIMPVNRRYPIGMLLDACRRYPLKPRRRITFEYVLIDGVNDTREDARRLLKLLRGIRCKVNLIPLNPHPDCGFRRPPDGRLLDFQDILTEGSLTALIRESRGQDILAACGQLKAGH